MSWYRAGSVSVTNGSPVFTGAGTDFVANVSPGDAFIGPDRVAYEVASVVSATQITLVGNYQSGSAAGQGYGVLPTQSYIRDLALGAATLLNTFGAIRDGIGAGLFPDGSEAAPAFRFALDQDTGIARAGPNSLMILAGGSRRFTVDADGAFVSGSRMDIRGVGSSRLTHSTNVANYSSGVPDGANRWCVTENQFGTEALSVVGGNIGIGTVAPRAKLESFRNTSGVSNILLSSSFLPASYIELNAGVNGVSNGGFDLRLGGASRMVIDDSGNMLVGVTAGASHTIARGTAQGDQVLNVSGLQFGCANFFSASGTGSNPSPTAMRVSANSTSGRSINSAGTLNASGADYAEYMRKAEGCGAIAKGDVCGVDVDGLLTRSWSAAISYVVKSTDPSLVGGDVWSSHMEPKPEEPGVEPGKPSAFDVAKPVKPEPVEDTDLDQTALDAWSAAVTEWEAMAAAHAELVEAYPVDHAKWTKDQAAYEKDLAAWKKDLEKARACVDRIAFSGQVPVNVSGDFAVGDYIVAASSGKGIKAVAVPDADITFEQYRKRIGKVWAVRDGRAWIDVQHG